MTKRITAKVEEYEKDGQTKGKYIEIGVILSNDKGEYLLLDPTVNLAGVMIKQRLLNPKKSGGSVICSIFDNDNQQGSGRPQQQAPQDEFDDDIPF